MSYFRRIIARLGGVEYAILWSVLACLSILLLFVLAQFFAKVSVFCKRAAERKKNRKIAARRIQYTLPERSNGYLRARLHTALSDEVAEPNGKDSAALQLRYAGQMLTKLKERPLTPVERLDVEEIGSLVALYSTRERWSGSEIKAVNSLLARLLKLSAKYEIAV